MSAPPGEEDLAAILDHLSEGIIVRDADGRLVYANAAAARILGFAAPSELLGAGPDEVLARFEVFAEDGTPFPRDGLPGRRALTGEDEPAVTLRFRRRPTGGDRWAWVRSRPIRDEKGQVRFAVTVWSDVTDRRRAEERDQALAAIVTTSDDAIVTKTLDGTVTNWNPAAERLYGWTAAEMVGQPIARIVPPDKLDELAEILARLGRGERIEHHETTRVAKDGRLLDVSVSISPLVDAADRVIGASKIARDVTARKRAEAGQRLLAEAGSVLTASLNVAATLEMVVRSAVGPLADWASAYLQRRDGTVAPIAVAHADPAKVAWARAVQARFPFDPDAPTGVAKVLRTGRAEHYPVIADAMIEAATDDAELRKVLREIGLTSAVIVPLIARGETIGALAFYAAESGRRYDERDLEFAEELGRRVGLAIDNTRLFTEVQAAEARYRALFTGSTVGVLLADGDGRVVDANAAAEAMLGTAGDELIGLQLGDGVLLTDQAAETAAFAQLSHEGEWRGEVELRRTDGTELPAQVEAVALNLPEGRAYLVQWLDATERRERDQLREEVFAAVSHDLKNPLTAVRANAQMMARRLRRGEQVDPARLAEGLANIDVASGRMVALIDDIVDAARLRAGEPLALNPEPVDLVELADRCVAQYRPTTGDHELRLAAEVPEVSGVWDPRRLELVVGNLLTNAFKYSPQGGEIVVRVAREVDGTGAWAVLSVCDPGIGIPAADLPHVFDRFHRAANVGAIAGTGLGLAGVAQIVAQHGGTISVESTEGQGSTFIVKLPLETPVAPD